MGRGVLSVLRSAERRNRPRWRARHLPRTALAERYVNRLIGDELERQLASLESHANESTANGTAAIRLKDSFDSTNSL
jgi:hypothetical protein